MAKRATTMMIRVSVLTLSIVLFAYLRSTSGLDQSALVHAQPQELIAPAKIPRYVGLTKCAACHFKQYKDWKKSPHGKTFDNLPAKYKEDANCLKCHTTGFGQPSTLNDTSASHASGVSCEACHGPGGEHAKMALTLVGQKEILSTDTVNLLRSKIQRTALDQCIKCHVTKAHKPHPEFDREEPAEDRLGKTSPPRKGGFFQVH